MIRLTNVGYRLKGYQILSNVDLYVKSGEFVCIVGPSGAGKSTVFQDFKLLEDRDVYENVALALWATGVRYKQIKKRILKILAEVGLSHRRYSMIHELSGGEQQRVAIARALANEPFVLLADEPTGNLDAEATNDIMNLLKRINNKGTAIVMATHKSELVNTLPVKVIQIKEGKVIQ